MAKKRKHEQVKIQHPLKASSQSREIKLPPFAGRYFTCFLFIFYLILALLFLGQSLLPSSMLFGTDFLAGDLMTRIFISETHGVPFWQPFVFGGVPFVDAVPGDLFYPGSFLIRSLKIIPYYSEPPWLYLIHFALAGLFIYLLLIELGLGRLPSVISGIAYMFTGQIVSLIYAGHVGKIIVCCLLPGLFWLIHRGVRLGRWREFVWAGGLLGFILLSPQIQMAYYVLLATGLFWLVLVLQKLRLDKNKIHISKAIIGLFSFLMLGFMFAASLYIPIYNYIPFSPRGGEGRGMEFAKSWSMPPEETINAIIPDFSGMSIGNTAYDTYWGQNVFKLHSEYIGALPVLLALLGIFLTWRHKERKYLILFFFGLLVLGLLLAWGAYTPCFSFFYTFLPYYRKLRASGMAFFLVSFSTACLTGFGAEEMLKRREVVSRPGRDNILLLGLGIISGLSLLLGLIVSGARDGFITFLGSHFVNNSQKYQQLQANYEHFVSGTFLFALFLILQVVLIILLLRKKLPKAWWAGLAIGLLVIDLWHIDFRFRQIVPSPSEYQGFEKDEVVRVLEGDSSLYRVFPLQYDKIGNYLSLYHIQNILGEHPDPLKRYTEFVGVGKNGMVDGHNLRDKPNVLNLLNTKYLITANKAEDFVQRAGFILPRLQLILDGTFKVYENLDVLPRAFCVGKYEINRNSDQILERIGQTEFNPAKAAILEEDPGLSLPAQDSSLHWSVNIIRNAHPGDNITTENPNQVKLNCESTAPSLLILSQNQYPAWKAYIDGRPTRVFRADYTFCAVYLPQGKHEVAFRYESRPYQLGKIISLLALFILVLSLIVPFVQYLVTCIRGYQSREAAGHHPNL